MAKSVAHYRRRVQQLAGQHARVHAWRSKYHDGALRYRIECLICEHAEGLLIPVGWTSDYGCNRVSADFHAALRSWAVHKQLVHWDTVPADYDVVITASDKRIAERQQQRYAHRVQMGAHLVRIFAK